MLINKAGKFIFRKRIILPLGIPATIGLISKESLSVRYTNVCLFTSVNSTSCKTGKKTGKQRTRRRKAKYEQFSEAKMATSMMPTTTTIEHPFSYSGDSVDDYKRKADLSPWVPVPDSVARKIFDRAIPEYDGIELNKEDEVHVELGSGDGRVNFHAIQYGIGESIGIDVDEEVIKLAEERLQRIHPQPNLRFIVSDLLDPISPAWKEVSRATILTMYFTTDGLEKIKPYVEQGLRGRRCKVFTCGYAMPGWESQIIETVLDIPIYFYDWGNQEVNMMNIQPTDSFIDKMPVAKKAPSDNMDQYMGRKNKKSTFKEDPLPGYHPDDLIDYRQNWMSDFQDNNNTKK